MAEFVGHRQKIQQSAHQLAATAEQLLKQMEDADSKFDEQSTTIASLEETIRLQQDELDRISTDFQDKLDRRDEENALLRSQLGDKEKTIGILSRAVGAMMTSARHINAVGMHAFSIIKRDQMGDKIVTQLRGRPERPIEHYASGKQEVDPRTPAPPFASAG